MKKVEIERFPVLDITGKELMNIISGNVSLFEKKCRKIVITSALKGEGKSFVTLQLARTLANSGKNVAIVDADLRNSQFIQQYQIVINEKICDLKAYLSGHCSIDDVLYKTDISDISIILSKEMSEDPISLIETQLFSDMLEWLTLRFDFVLVDTPPVGITADAARIARKCDGVILVARYNKTNRKDFKEVGRRLEFTGCPILGCIINKVNFKGISVRKHYGMIQKIKKLRE